MEALFLKILNMSITGAYVIVAVILVRLLLARMPKRYAYWLWSVVLFRLVCPVSLASVFSLFRIKPFDMTIVQSEGTAMLRYIPENIGSMPSPEMTVGIPIMNAAIHGSLPDATPHASVNPMQVWIFLGTVLWATGLVLFLAYNFYTYFVLKRRMATAVRLEGNVYESDRIRSPFLLGFLNPRIYMPFAMSEAERAHILAHERMHLRRMDHIIKPVAFLVLVLHWFNPLAWLAYNLMAKDMEMRCDELVLKDSDAHAVKEYSTALVSFAANRRFLVASPLAFGETGIRERVKNVLRNRTLPKWSAIAVLLVCVGTVAACATNPMKPSASGALNPQLDAANPMGPSASNPEASHTEAANTDASHTSGNNPSTLPAPLSEIPYGNFRFERPIYMNPLSSFLPMEGMKEYYTLTDTTFVMVDEQGQRQRVAITWEEVPWDAAVFRDTFIMADPGILDTQKYAIKRVFHLKDTAGSRLFHVYQLDDEIWLARVNRDRDQKEFFWSIYGIAPVEGTVPDRISLAGWVVGVEDFLKVQGDFVSSYENDTCLNITPEDIKSHSGYRVFKYNQSCASFLLYEGEVYPLGEWFGGFGVVNLALADLNADGLQELYFTTSSGSGLHRSHAAYFEPATREIMPFSYTHLNKDMMFAYNPAGGLSLHEADVTDFTDFTHFSVEKKAFLGDVVMRDGKMDVLLEVSE
jgi:beta-lactamase regulating signal transducer with metallopeptidase domain